MSRKKSFVFIALMAVLGLSVPEAALAQVATPKPSASTLLGGTCEATIVPVWLIIDGCHIGMRDVLLPNGCSITDAVSAIADDSDRHGEFIRDVNALARELVALGFMTHKNVAGATHCAAWSSLP